jgi:hypothetical protein
MINFLLGVFITCVIIFIYAKYFCIPAFKRMSVKSYTRGYEDGIGAKNFFFHCKEKETNKKC